MKLVAKLYTVFATSLLTMALSMGAHANTLSNVPSSEYIGQKWMQGAYHTVHPQAMSDGQNLIYTIQTPRGETQVKGTVAARQFIHEVGATEILRQRSTVGTALESAAGRTFNIVETPVRVVKGVVNRAADISSVEQGILFLPEEVLNGTGNVIRGVGELAVTGKRITTSAASTKCSGFNCVEKAGEDIWSGFNSLMGKHNSARNLHHEFGTDPQTANKAYRKQIDRLAYAESYTATTVKLGVGSAGIDYLSPAMRSVGWYNNGEFVAGYEDAHRRKNFEKQAFHAWGANPALIEGFYQNDAYTKRQRRRFFKAVEAINDPQMRVKLLHDAQSVTDRSLALGKIAEAEFVSRQAYQGQVTQFLPQIFETAYVDRQGRKVAVVYADYLAASPQLRMRLSGLRKAEISELRVIGRASMEANDQGRREGIRILEVSYL